MKGMELRALLCVAYLLGVEKRERDWVGKKGRIHHPLSCFLKRCDSMRVRWWGAAKDLILKGIVALERWGIGERHGSEDPLL
jgi:hypothetical protein